MSNEPNGTGTGADFVLQRLTENEVYQVLETAAAGIGREEAEKRLHKYGRNTLAEKKGKPLIVRFLSNFTHLMAILLWVGAIVGFVAQMPQLGVAVILVNVINGCFSFFQEFRAEKATEALKKLLPAYARVIRGGEEARVLAEELVPGDVLLLAEGDRISADCRLVDDNDLKVNQSTLTGESNPVHKARYEVLRDDLTRSEMPNLVFAGTTVASGTGRAVVYATGMKTEFGKIAGLTQSLHEAPSPLQKEMNRITRVVTVMAVSIGVVLFILAIFLAGADLAESFIFALGMIVAFVPEGLLPTVTLSLATGRSAHGQARRADQKTILRGDAGLHHRHLHRQDRHPDPERDDRQRPVAARAEVLRHRRGVRAGRQDSIGRRGRPHRPGSPAGPVRGSAVHRRKAGAAGRGIGPLHRAGRPDGGGAAGRGPEGRHRPGKGEGGAAPPARAAL